MIAFDSNGTQIDVDKDLGQHDRDLSTLPQPEGTDQEKLDGLVGQYAQMFAHGARTPVLKRPGDVGMDFDEVQFPSKDGVPLEAWYIPAASSDRLLVVNHPMTCNRHGFPGHLEPWRTDLGVFGGFEVDFLTELRFLHDAGYNILTYDLRNHGLSSDANGVTSGLGLIEARDVVGSLRYVRSREDLAAMKLGLYSRCMGGNSTIVAMNYWPEEFDDVEALVVLNAVSGKSFIEQGARNIGVDPDQAREALATSSSASAGCGWTRRARSCTPPRSRSRPCWHNCAATFSSTPSPTARRSSTRSAPPTRSSCGSRTPTSASTPTTTSASTRRS